MKIADIKNKITEMHAGDTKQLEVVFSDDKRIIVEAPAGYGKTTTMVSRIAYLYVTGHIPNPKKMLGLTFSVNAALKVKRDVASKLPMLIGYDNNPISICQRINITNYHGFCKGILKKHGRLLSPFFSTDLNLFLAVGDTDDSIKQYLSNTENKSLKGISEKIIQAKELSIEEIESYLSIVEQKLLPQRIITHNSIILFTLKLFRTHPTIQDFYRKYYPLIVVDEFQDTNRIAWNLLKCVIGNDTHLVFLGDSLQRIYGFIGALPNIMDIAKTQFEMKEIKLSQNYRFRNNTNMLRLDKNIRKIAQSYFNETFQNSELAQIPFFYGITHENECQFIINKIISLKYNYPDQKITVLFKQRGPDVSILQEYLANNDIDYFYGMFKDDDIEYVRFHNKCAEKLIQAFGVKRNITNKALEKYANSIKNIYSSDNTSITKSLIILLDALVNKIKTDYSDLLPDERYDLLQDIFENKQLKQSMEYVNAQVILSTVHGAKGLEWDHVIIADIEPWVFPSFSVCGDCENRFNKGATCSVPNLYNDTFRQKYIDELSAFYVAVTRAKKQVYFSASNTRYNNNRERKQSKSSCFISLPGINASQNQIID